MKTPDTIKAVVSAMCAALPITFVRAEQGGARPKGLFLSYKTIQQGDEPAWQNSSETLPDPDDGTKSIKRSVEKSDLTVSFAINAPAEQYGEAWDAALCCLAWFESEEARTVYQAQGLAPKSMPRSIQDRSAILETGYETRLGFDIQFAGKTVTETSVDAVDLAATVDSITEV